MMASTVGRPRKCSNCGTPRSPGFSSNRLRMRSMKASDPTIKPLITIQALTPLTPLTSRNGRRRRQTRRGKCFPLPTPKKTAPGRAPRGAPDAPGAIHGSSVGAGGRIGRGPRRNLSANRRACRRGTASGPPAKGYRPRSIVLPREHLLLVRVLGHGPDDAKRIGRPQWPGYGPRESPPQGEYRPSHAAQGPVRNSHIPQVNPGR